MRRLLLATFAALVVLTKTDPLASQSRLGTIESIVERGTYQLDLSSFRNTIDKISRDGHFYSHQPPLLSTLEAPVYWVLRLSGARFHNRGRFVLTYAFTLLTNGVALALTVLVFAGILKMAAVAQPWRDVLAVLLPLGTWLLPYALVTNNHGISALLVAVLTWLLLTLEWQGSTAGRALAIGVVLGLLVAIEILPVVSFAPLGLIYVLMRRDLDARARLLCVAGVAMPLVAHAVLNIPITGDVIPAGFHAELFRFEGSGFDESALTGTLKHASLGDAASYAWQSLFAVKGFFVFAPLCLLGLVCGVVEWRWWAARARGTYVVLAGSAAISLIVAVLTTNNLGGSAVGFRHATYLSPVFAVMLLPWLTSESSSRCKATVAIASVSTVLMLVFAAPDPWSSLTLEGAAVGTWDQYVPMLARIVRGTLLLP